MREWSKPTRRRLVLEDQVRPELAQRRHAGFHLGDGPPELVLARLMCHRLACGPQSLRVGTGQGPSCHAIADAGRSAASSGDIGTTPISRADPQPEQYHSGQ